MANEPIVITKQYKDHTVKNPVNDLSNLPFNAHSVHTQLTRELNVTIQVLDEKTGSVLERLLKIKVGVARQTNLSSGDQSDHLPSSSSLVPSLTLSFTK